AFNDAVLNAMTARVAVVGHRGEILAVNQAWKQLADQRLEPPFLRLQVGQNALTPDETAPSAPSRHLKEGLLRVLNGLQQFEQELPYGSEDTSRWLMVRVERIGAGPAGAVIAGID